MNTCRKGAYQPSAVEEFSNANWTAKQAQEGRQKSVEELFKVFYLLSTVGLTSYKFYITCNNEYIEMAE